MKKNLNKSCVWVVVTHIFPDYGGNSYGDKWANTNVFATEAGANGYIHKGHPYKEAFKALKKVSPYEVYNFERGEIEVLQRFLK